MHYHLIWLKFSRSGHRPGRSMDFFYTFLRTFFLMVVIPSRDKCVRIALVPNGPTWLRTEGIFPKRAQLLLCHWIVKVRRFLKGEYISLCFLSGTKTITEARKEKKRGIVSQVRVENNPELEGM